MRYDYYEQLWEYQRRRMEEERLYIALALADTESWGHKLKVMLGHAMIRAGAWLAGEQVPLTQTAAR